MKGKEAFLKEGVYKRGWRDGAGEQPQNQELLTSPIYTKLVRKWYSKGYEDGRRARLAACAKAHQAAHHAFVPLHRGKNSPELQATTRQIETALHLIRELAWVSTLDWQDTSSLKELFRRLSPVLLAGRWKTARRWLRSLPVADMSDVLIRELLEDMAPWRANLGSTLNRYVMALAKRGKPVPSTYSRLAPEALRAQG